MDVVDGCAPVAQADRRRLPAICPRGIEATESVPVQVPRDDARAATDAGEPSPSHAHPASDAQAEAHAVHGNRRLRIAVGLSIGVALVAAMLAVRGPGAVADALARTEPSLVAAAVVTYALFFTLRGLRWRLLLGPGRTGAGTAALATAAGWMVSTYVPMKAGDVARAAWMGRRHGNGVAAASATVALERLLDVAGLAAACTLALAGLRFAGTPASHALDAAVTLAWLLPALGLCVLALLAMLMTPARRRNRLLRFVGRALDQARTLRSPRLWVPAALLSAAIIASQVMVYVFLVLAFLPDSPVLAVMAATPFFLLSFAIAFTPGHLGTYEAAFVFLFAGLGGAPADLLPVALALHLTTASMVTVLGGLAAGALWAQSPRTTRLARAAITGPAVATVASAMPASPLAQPPPAPAPALAPSPGPRSPRPLPSSPLSSATAPSPPPQPPRPTGDQALGPRRLQP